MGILLTLYCERRDAAGQWEVVHPAKTIHASSGSSTLNLWLAGVKYNGSIAPIAKPRGMPVKYSGEIEEQFEYSSYSAFSASWLELRELQDFDYSILVKDVDFGREPSSLREALGAEYFDALASMKDAGVERVVFWFEN